MGDYSKLVVWNKAMDLTVGVYKMTEKLPAQERFGLINQMRRAAVSIPSNIAEGYSRFSDKEFGHFLTIARGSGAELETQLLLCARLNYVNDEEYSKLHVQLQEVQKMIASLLVRVRAHSC